MTEQPGARVPLAERLAKMELEEEAQRARAVQARRVAEAGETQLPKALLGAAVLVVGGLLIANALKPNASTHHATAEVPSSAEATSPHEGARPDHISLEDSDRMTTYATALGRAAGCGIEISPQGAQMGRWIRSITAPGRDEEAMMLAFKVGLVAAEKAQLDGESPDSCSQVRTSYRRFVWPDA